jgi:hypothetical protein
VAVETSTAPATLQATDPSQAAISGQDRTYAAERAYPALQGRPWRSIVALAAMLYVGCSWCRAIGPFWCAGQFMLHAPIPAEPSPWGPVCSFCGVMSPSFTCGRCWTTQWLYLPGMNVPAQATGPGQLVAAVVQAQPNAGEHELKGLLIKFATSVVEGAGDQLGQDAANGLAGWAN